MLRFLGRTKAALQIGVGLNPQKLYAVLCDPASWCGFFLAQTIKLTNSEKRSYSENIGVERYFSPPSGSSTTMVLPSLEGLFATSIAANSAAPEEIPAR